MDQRQKTAYPEGISGDDAERRPLRHVLNWVSFVLLAAALAFALTGALGGASRPVREVTAPAATMTVKVPAVIRNGMFFETAVVVEAHAPIAKPTLAVSESYWRDITINTSEPQAASETSENGMFAFEYGAMKAGDALRIKFDGQINPSLVGTNAGTIELRDDKRVLARLPLTIKVLP